MPSEPAVPPPPPAPPPPPPPPAPPQRQRSVFRRYGVEAVVVFYVLVFVAAILVPTWLLGGFERAGLPEAKPGEKLSNGEVTMTVRSASIIEGKASTKGREQLAVSVHAVNRTDANLNGFSELAVLGEPLFARPTAPEAKAADARSLGGADTLPSRLPMDVNLVWTLPTGKQPPDHVAVTLRKRSYEEDFAAQGHRWKSPKPWLTVEMPVKR